MTNLRIDPATLTETEEQQELRSVLREFFAVRSGPDLWRRMAGELELPGLAIPEKYGGSGYSFAELAVVLQESGRALCRAPLLSTVVLAAYALMRGGDDEACARYLPRIAAGSLTATLVFGGDITAERGANGWTLHGHADFVLDGADAGLIVVQVADRLFACESGVERTPHEVLDETRGQAHLEFLGTAAVPVGHVAIGKILDIGRAAVAAEQVGGTGHALDATVSYVGQRKQFGRPIGSFQAVKHRLAGLLVEYEAARSASAYATACVAADSPELPVAAAAASTTCCGAYRLAVAEYVQLHGGTGFTWEHPAHLYVRRARSTEVLFGTAQDQALRLATALGIG